jgi:hypothetical protein
MVRSLSPRPTMRWSRRLSKSRRMIRPCRVTRRCAPRRAGRPDLDRRPDTTSFSGASARRPSRGPLPARTRLARGVTSALGSAASWPNFVRCADTPGLLGVQVGASGRQSCVQRATTGVAPCTFARGVCTPVVAGSRFPFGAEPAKYFVRSRSAHSRLSARRLAGRAGTRPASDFSGLTALCDLWTFD